MILLLLRLMAVSIFAQADCSNIGNVGLCSSKNAEWKSGSGKCVIYSSGTLNCTSIVGDGSGITGLSGANIPITGSTQTWTIIESTNIAGSTGTFCFSTVIASTQEYRIDWRIVARSAMFATVKFGNTSIDRGTNYKYGAEVCSDSSCAGNNATGVSGIPIDYTGASIGVGDFFKGTISFSTVYGNTKIISVEHSGSGRYNAGGNFQSYVGGGMYTGSSPPNIACIDSSVSNSFSGIFILWTKTMDQNGL